MISFIVPVYNAEKTVERCVLSILNQQYPDKQIILVNDGSKDRSLEILRALEEQHPQIVVIDKPNGGVSSARNAGLAVCSGKYVTFVDSDDYYLSDDYAADKAKVLDKHENVDLVIAGFTFLTGDRRKTNAVREREENIETIAEEYWQLKETAVMNTPWNKMFRADRILENFPVQMTMGEDAVFVLRYLKNCRAVAFCDNCGYGYVFENTSTTADFRKKVAYDMNQARIYYDAIHDFWACFLPAERIAFHYLQMRADEVYLMMYALLHKKGVWAYCRRDITEVIADERFIQYYPLASAQYIHHPRKKLMKAVFSAGTMQVKMLCFYEQVKNSLRARLGRK